MKMFLAVLLSVTAIFPSGTRYGLLRTADPPEIQALSIENRLMKSAFRKVRTRVIDTVVIHSSYNAAGGDIYSVPNLIRIYERYGVSAHYLIDRQGTVYRLVQEQDISYHAGVSKMPDGRTGINDFSIGIELMNTKQDRYTEAQYRALQALIADLKLRYPIRSVVGHGQIAPERRSDPWNFHWASLQ